MLVARMRSEAEDERGFFAGLEGLRGELKLVVQAFDPEAVASVRHLELALFLAKRAHAEGKAAANSVDNEFLLFAAASAKMDEAIVRGGVKSVGDFLIAIDCSDSERERKNALEAARKFLEASEKKLEFAKGKNLAEKFGLSKEALANFEAEELVLEKIALSRLA